MKLYHLLILSVLLIMASCSKPSPTFEAEPFGVTIGAPIDSVVGSLLQSGNYSRWKESSLYNQRLQKRAGIRDSLLDRTPMIGRMLIDSHIDDSKSFVGITEVNLPLPTKTRAYLFLGEENGMVSSLTSIHLASDTDDLRGFVKSYISLFKPVYGDYKALGKIEPIRGENHNNLLLIDEGAFLWEKDGHSVQLFVNEYPLERVEELRDLGPMDRYEVVIRYQ